MHFETDGNDFIEVKVRNKIQSRAEGKGMDTKMVMDIPFTAKLHASYILPRLAVQESDMDPLTMFHGPDGSVRRLGIEELKIDREFKNYRMTISFSAIDTLKTAETFIADSIQITKLFPEDKHMFAVEFTVQTHPYHAKDIGNLHKNGIEMGCKMCFLQFEENQRDLATAVNQ